MMTIHRRRILLPLVFLILLSQALLISGYASWLKCFIDLDDTEVIMNYNVVPFDEATHKVQLQVKLDDDNADWTTEPITYAATSETTIRIKLSVPDELGPLDIQYVVEATKGALFTSRRMCDGSRSHAPAHDAETLLVVDGSQPTVDIWAGWASGHSAVSLTEKLVLRRDDAAGDEF